ncbi:LysE family translocator [Modicisalibacter coralii]|uniref:LysE family translocator n=1 Tax=Modicisalibacter coralii TaxID=2304602 RepID=UPI00100A76B5|nr:LysE family translocator [Halomonas coralii]
MSLSVWLLYITFAAAATLSPGPAALVALRNGLSGGTWRVAASSLGNITGIACVAGLATLGLGAVLHTSEWLFTLLKTCGALYLIYLGIRQWRSSSSLLAALSATRAPTGWSPFKTFGEGYLVAISNPKAILFFSALFPQFIAASRPLLPQFLILIATIMTMSFLALMGYGLLAGRLAHRLRSPRWARRFQRTLGGLFIGLGVSLFRIRLPA